MQTLRETITLAVDDGIAVPHFNVGTFGMLQAVVRSAVLYVHVSPR